jgi:D-alanyl-D-alanine carboxypeptidase (penicillin-binding protein 5/6)
VIVLIVFLRFKSLSREDVWLLLRYLFILLAGLLFFNQKAIAQEIRSRSVVVMEASTGKIMYAKNPDLRCMPASTTKLMTAIVVIENANLKDIVTVSRNAARVLPHKAGLREGDKVSIEELLNAALIGSANDAAVALAEAVAGSEETFVEMMNKKAKDIGAINTRFVNASGLPGKGQYTTAYDLAKIMAYSLKYTRLKKILGTRVVEITTENGKEIFLKNTNRLLWANDDVVGGKTGYTRWAKHCLVFAAERQQDTLVVALLGSPSRENLWREAELLVNKGFEMAENNAKPLIYVTKVSDDSDYIERKSYKKSKIKRSKIKRLYAHKISKKGLKIAGKKSEKVFVTKKQAKEKHFAKSKRNYRIVKKNNGGRIKG